MEFFGNLAKNKISEQELQKFDAASVHEIESSHFEITRDQLIDHHEIKRKLLKRQVQLLGFGGAIGTNAFGGIGIALYMGGPLSLLISYMLWITVIIAVNSCLSEMVTYLPIGAPFLRFPARYIDKAACVAASWTCMF